MIPVDQLLELSLNEVVARRAGPDVVARIQMTAVPGQQFKQVKLHVRGKIITLVPSCYGARVICYQWGSLQMVRPPFPAVNGTSPKPLSRDRLIVYVVTADMAPTVLYRFEVLRSGSVSRTEPFSSRGTLYVLEDSSRFILEEWNAKKAREFFPDVPNTGRKKVGRALMLEGSTWTPGAWSSFH